MLGVVECKCKGHYYVAHSGTVDGAVERRFVEIVSSIGGAWHPVRGPYTDGPAGFMKGRPLSGDEAERFSRTWERANERAARFQKEKRGQPYFPAGACAAQKALRRARELGALRGSLTEQFFSPAGRMVNPIVYVDESGNKVSKTFSHGESVPPCGTCEMILPMLLCLDEGGDKCNH